jgi:hypothetical protein
MNYARRPKRSAPSIRSCSGDGRGASDHNTGTLYRFAGFRPDRPPPRLPRPRWPPLTHVRAGTVVLLVGAGGAGLGVAHALLALGTQRVLISDIDVAKCRKAEHKPSEALRCQERGRGRQPSSVGWSSGTESSTRRPSEWTSTRLPIDAARCDPPSGGRHHLFPGRYRSGSGRARERGCRTCPGSRWPISGRRRVPPVTDSIDRSGSPHFEAIGGTELLAPHQRKPDQSNCRKQMRKFERDPEGRHAGGILAASAQGASAQDRLSSPRRFTGLDDIDEGAASVFKDIVEGGSCAGISSSSTPRDNSAAKRT